MFYPGYPWYQNPVVNVHSEKENFVLLSKLMDWLMDISNSKVAFKTAKIVTKHVVIVSNCSNLQCVNKLNDLIIILSKGNNLFLHTNIIILARNSQIMPARKFITLPLTTSKILNIFIRNMCKGKKSI